MNKTVKYALSKVPEVTLVFWTIKIAATTLGETGGDSVTMTLHWGYLAGSVFFLVALVVLIVIQIVAKKFHPFLYWATIVASTTFGTTMADFADRSLGIGYTGGSSILLFCLLAVLGLWYWSLGSISVDTVNTPKVEAFYWAAITFSQTLGTALGDWMADSTGLGYEGGALVFAAALAVVVAAYYWTKVSRVTLFWVAFILTRPLGGDRWRFARQARRPWWVRVKSSDCLGGHCGFHSRVYPPPAATGWLAFEAIRNGGVTQRFGNVADVRIGSIASHRPSGGYVRNISTTGPS